MAPSAEASGRVRTIVEQPEGLVVAPDFVTEAEERALVEAFEQATFSEVRMRGQAARRTVLHFGYRYDYESFGLTAADPVPPWLVALRERAAALAEVEAEWLGEALVTRYPPGAGIGWHRDAPVFGPRVVGVSLLSPCSMRFQRRSAGVRRVFTIELAPRSAYLLSGPARSSWQHTIPPCRQLRYSVTFRTVRAGAGPEEPVEPAGGEEP